MKMFLTGTLAAAIGALQACSGPSTKMTDPLVPDLPAPSSVDDGGWETPAADGPAEDGCGLLSRTACMKSAACTLEATDKTKQRGEYLCRPAQGMCEEGLVEHDLPGGGAELRTRAEAEAATLACTDRVGCRFVEAECYCTCRGYGMTTVEDGAEAEDCDCYCGGGSPPACVSESGGGRS